MRVFIDDTYFIEYWSNNIVVKRQRERQEIPEHLKAHIKKKEGAETSPYVEELVGYYSNLEDALFYGFLNEKVSVSAASTVRSLQHELTKAKEDIIKLLDSKQGKKLKRYPPRKI